jgi:hypothetical protein
LLTAVSKATERAQRIQCVNNLRQQGVAVHVFLADNHGYPTLFANRNEGYPRTYRNWIAQLRTVALNLPNRQNNSKNVVI